MICASGYKRLAATRPYRKVRFALYPLVKSLGILLLLLLGGILAQLLSHPFEQNLPFLDKPPLVPVKLTNVQQVLADPTRPLYEGSEVFANGNAYARIAHVDELELADEPLIEECTMFYF